MDIVVKDLKVMAQISICTRNSEYRFQVINPAQCRGVLRGGVCGEQEYEAILTGTVRKDQPTRISNKLETGMCALFYVVAKESYKCLTTSVITHLAVAQ